MGGDPGRFTHSQPYEIHASGFSVSHNPLRSVPKIDNQLNWTTQIDLRIKHLLHFFVQGFSPFHGIRVGCGRDG
jgi:hypothetical protein